MEALKVCFDFLHISVFYADCYVASKTEVYHYAPRYSIVLNHHSYDSAQIVLSSDHQRALNMIDAGRTVSSIGCACLACYHLEPHEEAVLMYHHPEIHQYQLVYGLHYKSCVWINIFGVTLWEFQNVLV